MCGLLAALFHVQEHRRYGELDGGYIPTTAIVASVDDLLAPNGFDGTLADGEAAVR